MHNPDLTGTQAKPNQASNRACLLAFSLGIAISALVVIAWVELWP